MNEVIASDSLVLFTSSLHLVWRRTCWEPMNHGARSRSVREGTLHEPRLSSAWLGSMLSARKGETTYHRWTHTHRHTHTYLCVLFMDIMNNIFKMFKPRASEVKQTWPWVLLLGPGPPFFLNRFGDKVSDTSKGQRSFNVWLPLTSFSLTPRTKNGQIIICIFLLGICFILHRCWPATCVLFPCLSG